MDDHTLAEATYRVARELGVVVEGVLTTGSATAGTDTNGLTQAASYWDDASFWILRDSAEAGAAPEGEFALVSSFTSSVATLRNVTSPGSSALSSAAAQGDRY